MAFESVQVQAQRVQKRVATDGGEATVGTVVILDVSQHQRAKLCLLKITLVVLSVRDDARGRKYRLGTSRFGKGAYFAVMTPETGSLAKCT